MKKLYIFDMGGVFTYNTDVFQALLTILESLRKSLLLIPVKT